MTRALIALIVVALLGCETDLTPTGDRPFDPNCDFLGWDSIEVIGTPYTLGAVPPRVELPLSSKMRWHLDANKGDRP